MHDLTPAEISLVGQKEAFSFIPSSFEIAVVYLSDGLLLLLFKQLWMQFVFRFMASSTVQIGSPEGGSNLDDAE